MIHTRETVCQYVCLCWEGLKIINTQRSQGQIVINTVKPRGNRRLCACACVCVSEREPWRQREVAEGPLGVTW